MNIELLKDIASGVGYVTAIATFIAAVFKPFRTGIANYVAHKMGEDKVSKQRDEILKKLPEIDKKLDLMADQNVEIIKRVDQLESQVTTNEQDRLRAELYHCGDKCRRGLEIYPEEYTQVRDNYQKYVGIGGNHGANIEFEFITKYYNNQHLNG